MRSDRLIIFAGVLALGLVGAGCSKKKDTADANSASEPAAAAAPAGAAPVVATPAASASQSPVEQEANAQVKDLQLQVDAYQKIYKRKPASLAQMVQEGFLPALPPAPPGRRFEYDPNSNRVTLTP